MISFFDIRRLDNLLKDFYQAVKIRISIFDDGFNLVTEYPETAPEFCKLIRMSEAGAQACRICDRSACLRAKKLREPHIYTCHAGITEAITPIAIDGGVVGYAILAHMLPADGYEEAVKNACTLAERYGVPGAKSVVAVSEITKRTSEEIRSAAHILDAVASYVYISNLAYWKNDSIAADIDNYIKNNLGENLSSKTLCKKFNFSRTSLYQISLNAFGMGITQYISFCRIERAKEMLLEGKTIAETAEECGYPEYNYFCKVFKKHTRLSPGEFRNNK